MKPDFRTAVNTLMSMCLDILNGDITEDTFISNLKNYIKYFEQTKEKPMSTQSHSYITKG